MVELVVYMSEKEEKKPINSKQSQNITEDIGKQMQASYLDYAMSVITNRALPDVRDGLKPVQRRIIFAMYKMGLNFSSKTKKSANVIGDVLGKYHPHGDSSVYDAMVNMVQPFKSRYPLIIGQGNFGSLDGDPAAAYRYTEAKMSKIAELLIEDIEKKTVRWMPNYENTKEEPTVFPALLPNLLLNGTTGIAVGMATNIPPHNLMEVCDAAVYLLENEDATNSDLLNFVKGPDFPGGAVAYDKNAIAEAYSTGRGSVVVRGEAEIITDKNKTKIVITSIPYQVNKSELIKKISLLAQDKKITGVRDIRDESTSDVSIVIELKSSANPEHILNTIYKHTQLENPFHYNLVTLTNGVPNTLSLRDILEAYIAHRRDVIKKRTEFNLNKAQEREHILLGLQSALEHIDAIIKLIRASKTVPDAHGALKKKFKFTDAQATAILEMKLQKLAGLERKKIEDELKALQKLIAELKKVLQGKGVDVVLKKEIAQAQKTYGDDRRTKIINHGLTSITDEDLIKDEETVLVLTYGGYVKRTNPKEYKVQKRGGVGVIDLNTKEEDFIQMMVPTRTRHTLLFFTDKGKIYQEKAYQIPEGKRATKGKALINFLSLSQAEKVTSILSIESLDAPKYILLLTERGIIKKAKLSNFQNIRKNGIIAVSLGKDDKLCRVILADKDDDVILATRQGKAIRFKIVDTSATGRTSKGVRAIKLSSNDAVVGGFNITKGDKSTKLFTVSKNGYGKMTEVHAYKTQKRGGAGMKTMDVGEKTGEVVGVYTIGEESNELIMMSKKSQVVRVDISEIPIQGRQTKGVRIMKLRTGDKIATTIIV